MKYLCPVCGFNQLNEEPFDKKNKPSFEVCPCCGFEFGFDGENNKASFKDYRECWLREGTLWFVPELKPKNWDCKKQLRNIKL